MIIYTNKITPRLQYIARFIGNEICGEPLLLTTDTHFFSAYAGPKINYSGKRTGGNEIFIDHHSLLFEDSIRNQNVSCFDVPAGPHRSQRVKAFFPSHGDYPFDIFAAIFYLLSRYEEYLPHKKDSYGRFAHENSLAFNEKFLHLPLVNFWLEDFKKIIKEKFPAFTHRAASFCFQPTYDIDEAYAFKYKPVVKTAAGLCRSFLKGNWGIAKRHLDVLTNKSMDPYDAFDWLDAIHEKNKLHPVYFFHVASEKGMYDKNIRPTHPAMQQLIKRHAEKYTIGIHPSWKSGDKENLLESELRLLENISGKKITSSRQHYIRFTLPHTFRRLLAAGITDDYSMGYGSINGFRASVASNFYWFDLENNKETDLLLHPFCFMETNSFFEQKYLPQRAYEEMMHYYHIVKAVRGILITVWHNNFLGSYPLYQGWKQVYETFVAFEDKMANEGSNKEGGNPH